jgi:phosphatidylglycerol:prolipoprotein diacylglycerol transferase
MAIPHVQHSALGQSFNRRRKHAYTGAMIPYFTDPQWSWMPVSLFSLLVLTGVVAGMSFTAWLGRRQSIPVAESLRMSLWTVLPAYLGSHTLMIVFYYPERILSDPMSLLRFNQGMSSFGGLLIAVIAFFTYLRSTGQLADWRQRADMAMQGFIVGWIFGRMGCSVVHDHPGRLSDFFLAMQYPGGARHDLGFYEMLYTLLVIFPVSLALWKKNAPPGSQLISACFLYALFRFPSDYLRVIDTRYFGLTPAQYGSIVLLVLAFWLLRSTLTQPGGEIAKAAALD